MNQPRPIKPGEWVEIASSGTVQGLWPLDDDETEEDLSNIVYGACFDYRSDGPGYSGPLYVLVGGAIPEERPISLIRGSGGELELAG